jgi:cytochrome c-type biogenesis protein CcmH/NrfG
MRGKFQVDAVPVKDSTVAEYQRALDAYNQACNQVAAELRGHLEENPDTAIHWSLECFWNLPGRKAGR